MLYITFSLLYTSIKHEHSAEFVLFNALKCISLSLEQTMKCYDEVSIIIDA